VSAFDWQLAAIVVSFAVLVFGAAAWYNVSRFGKIGDDPWTVAAVILLLGVLAIAFGEEPDSSSSPYEGPDVADVGEPMIGP
jgi:hypothetical protein